MRNKSYILILTSFLILSCLFFSFWQAMILLIMSFFFLFFIKNQHLTISLIQLEILGLAALLLMSIKIFMTEKELIILFIVMVVVVIEASLGLSLVVKQARNLNKEFFKFNF